MADAVFGLPASLLVFGDPGGLFEKHPQIFGARLDQAGYHALLDDRVAARSQAGAEEEIGDIPAAAAHPVEIIERLAVPRDLAFYRDGVVLGVLTAGAAFGIVELQFDGSGAYRLAHAGTVEDDIRHRLAAQHLGGTLTHDPAHRIDYIRFAATIWTDDPHQITGNRNRGGINE